MPTIPLFKVLVKDLDEAVAFYTTKLGMTCLEDNRLGDYRWILVGFPEQPGFGINLDLARTPNELALVGCQAADLPLFSIATNDCLAEFDRMSTLGVRFEGAPDPQPWGTGVSLRDIAGNRVYLNQDA